MEQHDLHVVDWFLYRVAELRLAAAARVDSRKGQLVPVEHFQLDHRPVFFGKNETAPAGQEINAP